MAGAQYGTALLWTASFTWPLVVAVQTMCARIGMVTGQGIARAFRHKFPPRQFLLLHIPRVTSDRVIMEN